MAGLLQGPQSQLPDQPGLFGQGDETHRRDVAQPLVGPAGQGFDAVQAAAGDVDLWLVMQLQLVQVQSLAQGGFQPQPFLRAAVHFAAVETRVAAAAVLGLVHGHVGVMQQAFHVATVIGEHADADAGRRSYLHIAQLQRLPQGAQDVLAAFACGLTIAQAEHHHELVAG
ncbi:hypothetical protein D3C81_1489100 [compost metagenome]